MILSCFRYRLSLKTEMFQDLVCRKSPVILGFFAYGIIIEGRVVKRAKTKLFSIEEFVPEEHLLRKRDSAVQA